MNETEFRKLRPNASASTVARNCPDGEVLRAEPQRDQAKPLGEAVSGEAKSFPRTRVRFTGYRVRTLDPDNFAGGTKDLLDGLRHAGLLLGDESWRIILETEQVKVSKRSDQKTVIEIFEL